MINDHLDQCLAEPPAEDQPATKKVATVENKSITEPVKKVSPETSSNRPDAFDHLMNSSKIVFAEPQKVQQCFYLSENGTVSIINSANIDQRVSWSAQVQLKDRAARTLDDTNDGPTKPGASIELTLATALPSATTAPRRLVQHHSRLSVPVLKSILQKAIRRRKPLPAVRTAMELADKAWGELLRRLPVIIMEDSTLHPDVPLLVWLMMADAKQFVVPPSLVTRVLQIVFEVASCPWVDALPGSTTPATGLSMATLLYSMEPDASGILVWSLLARADYGGMKGDVAMLYRYAVLWHERLTATNLPQAVADRVGCISWQHVPSKIHAKGKTDAVERVTPLCAQGLDQLRITDLCVEGVDFHCSAVIDHLLSKEQLMGVCHDLLVLSSPDEEVPGDGQGRRDWLQGVLQSCMWHFSSGVNRRLALVPTEGKADHRASAYEGVWTELVAKPALDYQTAYIHQRLAR